MNKKGIFIIGTGTDIGKTYVSNLLVKFLKNKNVNVGYYKPVMSGVENIENSDVGYINKNAKINQNLNSMFSYSLKNAVSPHLACKLENKEINKNKILKDFNTLIKKYQYLIVEGCGGIICPINYTLNNKIFLEDIIKMLSLDVILVTSSQLGTINSTLLTFNYINSIDINIKGIIFNYYEDNEMCNDNINLIETITKLPTIAIVLQNSCNLILRSDFY